MHRFPGEEHLQRRKIDEFAEFKANGATKIRITVNDTNGEKYRSMWIEI